MRTASMVLASLLGGLSGCLDPLVSDEPSVSLHILPPGTMLPHVSTDVDLTRQIKINDGLSDSAQMTNNGVVMLRKGWAKGAEVQYWDLGDAPQTFGQLYRVMKREGEGETATLVAVAEHPLIGEALPGDAGYSPFLLVQNVVVTGKYQGEVLPSLEAITDAVELGLVEEPAISGMFGELIDGPIVDVGTTLDNGAGQLATATLPMVVNGFLVDMLPVGGAAAFRPLTRAPRLPRADAHRITLGNAVNPLAEPIFQNGPTAWTPVARIIECNVTVLDPPVAVDNEALLFKRDMSGNLSEATDRVKTWRITTTNKHWPLLVPAPPPALVP